jgi:hypothetical protein
VLFGTLVAGNCNRAPGLRWRLISSVLIEKLVHSDLPQWEGRMAKGKASVIVLSSDERRELDSLTRRRATGQALALRARIVLAAAAGWAVAINRTPGRNQSE